MNATHFLNIDLEIESNTEISLLVEELSLKLTRLTYHECEGKHRASFEAHQTEIEGIITEYVSVIVSLSEAGKRLWENCTKREFNLGFQSGATPKGYEKSISPNALKEIVSVNGQLGITIYAQESSAT